MADNSSLLSRRSRPIALLTDFGYEDPFVGVMKGVILGRCLDARFIDLTHGVRAHDVLAGALHLAAAAPYCPHDTVFLAVVDPGVGGDRRPLIMRSGSRLYVGPDNGLLWPAAAREQVPEVFHLDRPQYWLPQPSATFHGRDIFAPIAAMLAIGRAAEDFGTPILDAKRFYLPAPSVTPESVTGEVLLIDCFGNAVTNLRPEDLGAPEPGAWTFTVGGVQLSGPATHYGAVSEGEPLVLLGSQGRYEVAVNQGSAVQRLGLERGSAVTAQKTG